MHSMQEVTEGGEYDDNILYAPLIAKRSELETSGNIAYGVLEDLPTKPNLSYGVLEGTLEREKEKGQLREVVDRERAGSHDKQVGHREEREGEGQGGIIPFKCTRCRRQQKAMVTMTTTFFMPHSLPRGLSLRQVGT